MTPAGRHWWRANGLKITGGMLIACGVVTLVLSQAGIVRQGRVVVNAGLGLILSGAMLMVLSMAILIPPRR